MKGVVLAGGKGSRLYPLTRVTNKHLLPVYDRPMIFYPIQTLVDAGIRDIIVVTGGQNSGDFLRLLSNGKDFHLASYSLHVSGRRRRHRGCLAPCRAFCRRGKDMRRPGRQYHREQHHRCNKKLLKNRMHGAHILLKQVEDPERFGCPEIVNGKILGIEEKPKAPKSNYAVTGIYFYDSTVFEKIGKTKVSWRNELEITDVNNMYLAEKSLTHSVLDRLVDRRGHF